jgi:hypothetical protein
VTIVAANLTQMRALIDRCTRDGVRMVLQAGWDSRDAGGVFGPWVGGLIHHDASTTASGTWGALPIIISGRPDVPGPLAQFQAARGGVPQITVVTAGRANHGGAGGPLRTRSGRVIPADSFNRWGVGLEVANDGVSEPYSEATLFAIATWAFAVDALAADDPGAGLNIWGHREWAPTRKIDPRYDMDAMRQRIDQHADQQQEEDDDMAIFATRAEFDDAVRAAVGGVLHERPGADGLIRRAFTGVVQDGWHSEDWGTISLPAQLKPLHTAINALAAKVGALADDEAKTLTALGASEARLLAAIQAVIVDPQVDNDDPDAVAAALRDFLARETAPPKA